MSKMRWKVTLRNVCPLESTSKILTMPMFISITKEGYFNSKYNYFVLF